MKLNQQYDKAVENMSIITLIIGICGIIFCWAKGLNLFLLLGALSGIALEAIEREELSKQHKRVSGLSTAAFVLCIIGAIFCWGVIWFNMTFEGWTHGSWLLNLMRGGLLL